MRVKNWRKIAWAKEGSHGTYSGLRELCICKEFHLNLSGVRSYRRAILGSWKDRRVMSRFDRQNSRRAKRDRSNNAKEI